MTGPSMRISRLRRGARSAWLLHLAAVIAVASIGCAPAASATSEPGPASTRGPLATTSGTVASTLEACSLLTDAEIADATGRAVASEDPHPPDTTYPSACLWTLDGTNWTVALGVLPTGGAEFLEATVAIEGGTPISGLGDRAVRTSISDAILVLVGDTLLDVQLVAVGEPAGAAEQLAGLAAARLRS